MVRHGECLSYWGFELSSEFYEKKLLRVQREFKKSSSCCKFELLGVWVIGIILCSTNACIIGKVIVLLSSVDMIHLYSV